VALVVFEQQRFMRRIRSMRPSGHPQFLPWIAMSLVALFLAGCGGQRGFESPGDTGELPDQEVSDFVLTETDQGTPVWTLYARHAATYSIRNMVIARSIRVDFYDEDGQRTSELTAKEGEINQRTRDMTARGNVVIQTTEGTRMSSEVLSFDNRRQLIIAPDDQLVRVEREADVLTGYGFNSDPELRHFEFKSDVRARLRPKSDGLLGPEGGP
jgi:LPS export ABC transporter protein LptC